jgi:hypothetical protein
MARNKVVSHKVVPDSDLNGRQFLHRSIDTRVPDLVFSGQHNAFAALLWVKPMDLLTPSLVLHGYNAEHPDKRFSRQLLNDEHTEVYLPNSRAGSLKQ